MSKKKPPTTIEECNAEMELTQKKIRQYAPKPAYQSAV